MPKAHVFLTRNHETLLRTSGDRGRFCFETVAPGQYQLVAQKAGYLDAWYKARPGQKPGVPVTVEAGAEVSGVKIEMVARAILAGVVVDADGEPVADADVTVSRRVDDEVASQQSDDRGRFRFPDLPPGSYTVGVSVDNPKAAIDETFYTHGVKLEAGHDLDTLTLTVGQPEAATRHLTGRVSPPIGNATMLITAVRPDGTTGSFSVSIAADGTFSADGLPARRYLLEFRSEHAEGRLEVDLTASDAEHLIVTAHPSEAVDVGLVVRTEGDGPPFALLPRMGASLDDGREWIYAKPGADGSWAFHGVRPRRYRLRLATYGQAYFAKQIRYGGKVVSASEIEVRNGDTAAVEVVMSSAVASVEGRVTGESTRRVTILLVDDEGYRDTVADQRGRFQLGAVRPEKYRLLAIEDFDEDEWRQDLAAALQGVVVELAERDHQQIDVPLVTAEAWLAALQK
jgi:hypothetical protein